MMFLMRLVLFSLLVFGCRSQASVPTGKCKVWCQAPCLYPWEPIRYYCCHIEEKSGDCPPIRTACPESIATHATSGDSPPPVCLHDYQCAGTDKCCFDQCLLHYTCKPTDP